MRIRYMLLLVIPAIAAAEWAAAVLLTLRRGQPSNCPSCHSPRIRPSWPKVLEKVLPHFVCPYRCEFCQKRYFARRAEWVRDASSTL